MSLFSRRGKQARKDVRRVSVVRTLSAEPLEDRTLLSFVLRIEAGTDIVVLEDDGALDTSPSPGIIGFVGSVGPLSLNVTTANSKPVIGSVSVAELDLSSINLNLSGAPVVVTISATDTAFVLPQSLDHSATIISAIGGAGGTVELQTFGDLSNNEFGNSGPGVFTSGLIGPFGPSAFFGQRSAVVPYSGQQFSLTSSAAIALGAFSTVSLDIGTSVQAGRVELLSATYSFTGSPGNQESEPLDAQPVAATLAALSRGSSLTAAVGTNSINSSGFTMATTPDLVGGFYEFSITPDPNFKMTLSELAFSERRSSSGIGSFEIRTSLDAFATSIFQFDVPDNTANRRHTIALPASFQNLTSSVAFRLYGYDSESTSGTWRLGISSGDANSGIPANLSLSGDLTLSPQPLDDIEMVSVRLVDSTTVEYVYQTTGNPDPFHVGLFRSMDEIFDAEDVQIGVFDAITSVGVQETRRLDLQTPLRLDRDRPFVLVVADPDAKIIETSDTNNHKVLGFVPDSPYVQRVAPVSRDNSTDADRPNGQSITQIILHALGNADAENNISFFQNRTDGVSVHYVVSQSGTIIQLVQEEDIARHAPPSNNSSIGIELEDCRKVDKICRGNHITDELWPSDELYEQTALLVRDIASRHGLLLLDGVLQRLTVSTPGPFEHMVAATGDPSGIGPDHIGIIAHGQVANRTGGRTDPQHFDWTGFLTRVNRALVWELNSPANLLVTDPFGNRTGVDPTTGNILLEIPGAEFSGEETHPQTIAIPFAADGEYTVQVVGTHPGDYRLVHFAGDRGAKLIRSENSGTTATGLITTYMSYPSIDCFLAQIVKLGNLVAAEPR